MHTDDPDRASACLCVHLWLILQETRHSGGSYSASSGAPVRESDFLSLRRLTANTRHRRRRCRRRRWRRGNRCRGRRGWVLGASRRDQRRRDHDGNEGEANHFFVHPFPPELRDSSTLQRPKGPIAHANVEWGIPVPARWRNIGIARTIGLSTKILLLQSLGASS